MLNIFSHWRYSAAHLFRKSGVGRQSQLFFTLPIQRELLQPLQMDVGNLCRYERELEFSQTGWLNDSRASSEAAPMEEYSADAEKSLLAMASALGTY